MTIIEANVEQKIVQTRTFTVADWDGINELGRLMKGERFSGKLVIHVSQGSVNAVNAEESKKLRA